MMHPGGELPFFSEIFHFFVSFLWCRFWADLGYMRDIFSFLPVFGCHFEPSEDLWGNV